MVPQGYMRSVCALMAAAPQADAPITRCRNPLTSHFVTTSQAIHILFVDADISFEPENVFRLLVARKPIAAGTHPLKAYYWDQLRQERLAQGEATKTVGLTTSAGWRRGITCCAMETSPRQSMPGPASC